MQTLRAEPGDTPAVGACLLSNMMERLRSAAKGSGRSPFAANNLQHSWTAQSHQNDAPTLALRPEQRPFDANDVLLYLSDQAFEPVANAAALRQASSTCSHLPAPSPLPSAPPPNPPAPPIHPDPNHRPSPTPIPILSLLTSNQISMNTALSPRNCAAKNALMQLDAPTSAHTFSSHTSAFPTGGLPATPTDDGQGGGWLVSNAFRLCSMGSLELRALDLVMGPAAGGGTPRAPATLTGVNTPRGMGENGRPMGHFDRWDGSGGGGRGGAQGRSPGGEGEAGRPAVLELTTGAAAGASAPPGTRAAVSMSTGGSCSSMCTEVTTTTTTATATTTTTSKPAAPAPAPAPHAVASPPCANSCGQMPQPGSCFMPTPPPTRPFNPYGNPDQPSPYNTPPHSSYYCPSHHAYPYAHPHMYPYPPTQYYGPPPPNAGHTCNGQGFVPPLSPYPTAPHPGYPYCYPTLPTPYLNLVCAHGHSPTVAQGQPPGVYPYHSSCTCGRCLGSPRAVTHPACSGPQQQSQALPDLEAAHTQTQAHVPPQDMRGAMTALLMSADGEEEDEGAADEPPSLARLLQAGCSSRAWGRGTQQAVSTAAGQQQQSQQQCGPKQEPLPAGAVVKVEVHNPDTCGGAPTPLPPPNGGFSPPAHAARSRPRTRASRRTARVGPRPTDGGEQQQQQPSAGPRSRAPKRSAATAALPDGLQGPAGAGPQPRGPLSRSPSHNSAGSGGGSGGTRARGRGARGSGGSAGRGRKRGGRSAGDDDDEDYRLSEDAEDEEDDEEESMEEGSWGVGGGRGGGGGGVAAAAAAAARKAAAACGGGGTPVPAEEEVDGGRRSSKYRGVTRHRRSGRWEAHIWVKDMGRQVYLGGYEDEAHAAEAYDVAALKSKGLKVRTNFPLDRYCSLLSSLDSISLEELIMAVRRQSQGFSRGSSTYRGVTAHPSGRWESRIGIPGSKHIYLGLFEAERDAATAYDRSLVRLRGGAAATNFSLSEYAEELAEYHTAQQAVLLRDSRLRSLSRPGPDFEKWIKSGSRAFPHLAAAIAAHACNLAAAGGEGAAAGAAGVPPPLKVPVPPPSSPAAAAATAAAAAAAAAGSPVPSPSSGASAAAVYNATATTSATTTAAAAATSATAATTTAAAAAAAAVYNATSATAATAAAVAATALPPLPGDADAMLSGCDGKTVFDGITDEQLDALLCDEMCDDAVAAVGAAMHCVG